MPAPCTIVFGFCWMKSGVAAIVLPIVIIDQPITILAVWPVWESKLRRPAPSTRDFFHDCVCSMAWRLTKVHAT